MSLSLEIALGSCLRTCLYSSIAFRFFNALHPGGPSRLKTILNCRCRDKANRLRQIIGFRRTPSREILLRLTDSVKPHRQSEADFDDDLPGRQAYPTFVIDVGR